MKRIFKSLVLIAFGLFITPTINAQTCSTCNGKGYLLQSESCPSCHYGYIESTVTKDCNRCYGSGTVSTTCDNCSGKGTVLKSVNRVCPKCNGTNVVTARVSGGQCRSCSGSGKDYSTGKRCSTCNGEGVIYKYEETTCLNCVRGYVTNMENVTCSKCNGSGSVSKTCPQCQGRRHYTEKITTPCVVCGGTGSKTVKQTCPTCYGTGKSN